MNDRLTDYIVCDSKTGEYIQNLTASEVEMLKDNYTTANIKKTNDTDSRESSDLFHQYIKETCGSFYFHYYNDVKSDQFLFRFLYICTYVNYKGYVEFGNGIKEGKLIIKKDLLEMLKLSEKDYYRTVKYFEEENLISYDDNGFVKVNNEICVKGKIETKKDVVRMFNNAIRDLYENSNPKEHKKICLLIKLLPLINYKTNVICKNPTEDDVNLVDKYTLKELSEFLGYSRIDSMKRALMGLKVRGEKVIMLATFDNNKDLIIINPKIYYKGKDLKSMEGIINLFSIK